MAEKESAAKKPALARTVKDKWRAKHWFKVKAPGIFQHVDLGETMATEPEQLAGRTLEVTLGDLSGGADISKAHIKLRFQVERISAENAAETRFVGHELTSDYVRRLARRKRSKIDASVLVTTKDAVQMRLKPVAVGEHRLQSRLRSELRNRLRSLLTEEAASKTGAQFVREMLQGELGKTLSQGLRTLYPLKKIEIRRSEVLGPIAEEPAPPSVEEARLATGPVGPSTGAEPTTGPPTEEGGVPAG
jgi:small subunit ribosomal protein S3Ae